MKTDPLHLPLLILIMCLSLISLGREAPSSVSHSLYVVAVDCFSIILFRMAYLCSYRRYTINQWGEAAFKGSVLVSLCCHCTLAGWGQWDWECVCWIGMLRMGGWERRRRRRRKGGNLPGGNFWVRKLLANPPSPCHNPPANWQGLCLETNSAPKAQPVWYAAQWNDKASGQTWTQQRLTRSRTRTGTRMLLQQHRLHTYCAHVNSDQHESAEIKRQRNAEAEEIEEPGEMKGEEGSRGKGG